MDKIVTCRYFEKKELDKLFYRNILPEEIEIGVVSGVSDSAGFSMIIEKGKLAGETEATLKNNYLNVSTKVADGRIWIVGLDSTSLSNAMLNDEFSDFYLDKKSNPIELSTRCALHYGQHAYWTENVYDECFE